VATTAFAAAFRPFKGKNPSRSPYQPRARTSPLQARSAHEENIVLRHESGAGLLTDKSEVES
jgi:hypothetical protein